MDEESTDLVLEVMALGGVSVMGERVAGAGVADAVLIAPVELL